MAYSSKVIDHYENPRNVGSFDKGDESVGTGMVGAPACGDVMKLQIKVNPRTGVIEDARFKTYGCGSAIASSSLVTEWVKGKTLDQAAALKNSQIAEELAVSSGSACTSASLEPSYVLRALGRNDELAHSSIRFTLGRFTTEQDIDFAVKLIRERIGKLREMSPLWEMYKEGIDLNTVQWAAH